MDSWHYLSPSRTHTGKIFPSPAAPAFSSLIFLVLLTESSGGIGGVSSQISRYKTPQMLVCDSGKQQMQELTPAIRRTLEGCTSPS